MNTHEGNRSREVKGTSVEHDGSTEEGVVAEGKVLASPITKEEGDGEQVQNPVPLTFPPPPSECADRAPHEDEPRPVSQHPPSLLPEIPLWLLQDASCSPGVG